jgi:hypothetical protein
MKWFKTRFRRSLVHRWSFEASGTIWRIVPLASGQILGEVRQHQEKKASFFCLDERSGTVAWKDREFDEPWWIGIEAVSKGTVIFHTYERPDMPVHHDMIAVDLQSGREQWRVPDVSFWFLTADRVYAYRPQLQTRIVQEIVLATGEVARTYDENSSELVGIRGGARENFEMGDILLPVPSQGGEDEELERFTAQWERAGGGVTGVESLRLDDYLLVSYYIRTSGAGEQKPQFDNHLCVVDLRRGTLVHREILASSVPAPSYDTFYVRNGAVISVKDLRYLRAQILPRADAESAPTISNSGSMR